MIQMQAEAFSYGAAEVVGPDCMCDMGVSISVSEVSEVIAQASVSALFKVCTGAIHAFGQM